MRISFAVGIKEDGSFDCLFCGPLYAGALEALEEHKTSRKYVRVLTYLDPDADKDFFVPKPVEQPKQAEEKRGPGRPKNS